MTSLDIGALRIRTLAALLVVIAGACSAENERPRIEINVNRAAVIYGADDRVEPGSASQFAWYEGAAARAVALVPTHPMSPADPQDDAAVDDGGAESSNIGPSATDRYHLCPEERFGAQSSIADCSGVLLAADIVLTAGHCFDEGDGCDRYRYIFGYEREADATSALVEVQCSEMIIREVGTLSDSAPIDYALIRLGRPRKLIDALPIAGGDTVAIGEHMSSFGFPLGIPLKIDPSGRVLAMDRTGFNLSTDTYVGSSGSAIYSESGLLAGILTTGQSDFDWDKFRKCNASRVLGSEDSGTGERAMSAEVAVARACQRTPGLALCPMSVERGGSAAASSSDPQLLDDPAARGARKASASRVPKNVAQVDEEHAAGLDAGPAHTLDAGAIQRPQRRSSSGCSAVSRQTNYSTATPLLAWIAVLVLRRQLRFRFP